MERRTIESIGAGTVEKRDGKNKWRLRISVLFANGARERLSKQIECRNITEAKKRLDKWRLELLEEGAETDPSSMTLGEYLDEYIAFCRDEEELSVTTVRGYQDIVENRLYGMLDEKLCSLSPALIQKHYSTLRTIGGKAGKPLSGTSVVKAHSFLKTALKRAVVLGYIRANPCELVKPPSKSKSKTTSLTEEEVARMVFLLKGHPSFRFSMAMRITLATGMRRGEVCALRWQDVDLDNADIHVANSLCDAGPETKNAKKLILKDTKTDSSDRHIIIDEDTLEELKKYKLHQYYALAYNGIEQTEETPVVASPLGDWYRPDCFTKDFEAFRAQQGFDIRLHDLRHTQASLLIKNGEDIVTVSRRLGHARVSTTLDIYSHVMPGKDGEAAAKIGSLLKESVA